MWKAKEKTATLLIFLDILFPKQRYICEMLPLETKQSRGKLLHHSDLRRGRSVSRGNIQTQAPRQERLRRKEGGRTQLRD
jgi:hypothetical protein